MKRKYKRVIDLSHTEARDFFLKNESYANIDLPKYFVFEPLLQKISKEITGKRLSDFYKPTEKPCEHEKVNYLILGNKDGKLSWRPLQLIHPAIYVSIVNLLTEEENWKKIVGKFNEFQQNPNIDCQSIPHVSDDDNSNKAADVIQWWNNIEQQSIELSLNYDYTLHTDITNCYGSIYTHSIACALETKKVAKERQGDKTLLGNQIDTAIRNMTYGQTNGIPQGSVLMDFIAEIVLCYADSVLTEKIREKGLKDYKVLRYRDDYRIFGDSLWVVETIAKLLTESLSEFGFHINTQKTFTSNNVVSDSIKPDKLFWINTKQYNYDIQQHLYIIHSLSEKFPNSGSVTKALDKFYERIKGKNLASSINVKALIGIIIDIAFKNPRTYPISTAILSKLLSSLENDKEKINIIESIEKKFSKIPNIGLMMVWLQRITLKIDREREFQEPICRRLYDSSITLWNSNWLKDNLKNVIDQTPIIDESEIDKMKPTISQKEVQLFQRRQIQYEY